MKLYDNFLKFVEAHKNNTFRYWIKGVNDDDEAFYGKIAECISLGYGEYLIGFLSEDNTDTTFYYKISEIDIALSQKDNM